MFPCTEECRSIWKDGQVLEENVQYELRLHLRKDAMLAYPIVHESDLWAEIWKAVRKEAFGRNIPDECIEELKKKYTITRK
jgi:hypothetical protein